MNQWRDRPVEIANLFNPAFCAVLLDQAIKAYERETSTGLPYSLSFVILPVVLHERTRSVLPTTTRTRMRQWIIDNPQVKIGFAERVSNLIPIVKETILFGLQIGAFTISDDGHIHSVPRKISSARWERQTEPYECVRKAKMVGKWFGLSDSVAGIYSILGVQL